MTDTGPGTGVGFQAWRVGAAGEEKDILAGLKYKAMSDTGES